MKIVEILFNIFCIFNVQETIQQVAGLLKDALDDPKLKAALGEIMLHLINPPILI